MQTEWSTRFASVIGAALAKVKFDPDKHPRGEHGHWAPKGEGQPGEDVKPVGKLSTQFVPPHILDIAERVAKVGGRALIVGGSVRDQITGKNPKDYDLEVYGVQPDKLEAALKEVGRVDAVGKAFGVLKLRIGDKDVDVSIPRRENKVGAGHRGFIATPDPTMTITEAARRRDFTMNSMAMDPTTGAVYDPFNGMKDLKDGIIRHTDPTTFVEDPLRVLRAAQFAARFGMVVHPDTIALCRSIKDTLKELPRERVGEEWKKLLLKSDKPSVGMDVMQETGVLEVLHPEMQRMIGSGQDPVYHSEGDVFTHTKMVMDEAVKSSKDLPEDSRRAVIYSAMLHDIAKPQTREEVFNPKLGRMTVRNYGHEAAGEPVALKIMVDQMGVDKDTAQKAARLIGEHLEPKNLYKKRDEVTDPAIRRLARRLVPATMEELAALGRADSLGRRDLSHPGREAPDEAWLLERARSLKVNVEPPKPILMGRHLMERGVPPGPKMGETLRRVFELQMDGKIRTLEEALAAAGV